MSLRPFNESDLEAVNRLHSSVWWPERSAAGWRWLMANPASAEIDAPHGWVIDHGAGPEAFVGNFIQRFWSNDQRLHAATGYSIVVPPAQRGRSRALINAFIDQPACFARYTLNANARSSPLYQRHGMVPWPPETHTLKLSWLIDPAACLYGRGLREVVDRAPTLARLLGEQLSPLPRLNGERRLRQAESRLPDGVSLSPDLSQRSDYARFWTALRAEGRLMADRSPDIMRWRLSDPDLTVPPLSLAYRDGGRLTGFAVAMLNKQTPLEPPILEIIDLVALDNDSTAVQALVEGLRRMAPALGAAKVRLQVVSPDLLAALGRLGQKAWREGGWGHCHIAFDDGMQDAGWRPTPYDGDYSFCLRPLPARASAALRLASTPLRAQAVQARA
ncbi:N-acetyltransferase [Brevundimonas sanguinis]|uniref:N-acetyltransferase n=1 Tax=Brevundimonas sanguinis TaxID=3021811 RepID=UPI0024154935|nr:N-acetyltransferase [Brevundimonas sp. NCCP 15609]